MNGYLFTSALSDFMRFRKVAIWILIAIGIFGIGKLLTHLSQDQTAQDSYIQLSSTLVFHLLPLAAAIFSTAVLTQEVEQKTIVYLTTCPVPRWKLLLFRTLAAVVAVFLVSALANVAVSFSAYGRPWNSLMLGDMKALLVGSFAYTCLFVVVSLLINRSMIVCLLFAFAWETSIPNMPGELFWLSINSYLTAISQRPTTSGGKNFLDALGGMLGYNNIPAHIGWLAMAGLVVACLAFAMWWFSINEFIPREDAE